MFRKICGDVIQNDIISCYQIAGRGAGVRPETNRSRRKRKERNSRGSGGVCYGAVTKPDRVPVKLVHAGGSLKSCPGVAFHFEENVMQFKPWNIVLLGCCGMLLASASAFAEEPDWKLRVDLVDGSRVIGATSNTSLKLDVGFDELTIPLDRLRRVEQGEKPKTMRVELNNGDILTGKWLGEPLNLETIFGPVKIKTEQVISIDVVPNEDLGWLPTEKGLMLYYALDDGERATNHAMDKHHGQCTNVKWLEKGRRGGAFEFDGSGRITVAHHADLCPEQFTMAAWIYPIGETSNYQVVWAKTTPGGWSPGYGLVRLSGDAKHLYFFVNNYSGSAVKAEIPHDKWSHVAGVFDGSTLSFYLDGKMVESKNLRAAGGQPAETPLITHTQTPLTFGGDGNNYYGWTGKLDEIAFYNRPLDAREIRRLYETAPRELLPRSSNE